MSNKNESIGNWYDPEELNTVELFESMKLSKELKTSIIEMGEFSREEINTLVTLYYQMQKERTALNNRLDAINRGSADGEKNTAVIEWVYKNCLSIEKNVIKILDLVCQKTETGRWLRSTMGIGPVIAAGLMATFDVEKCQYASQFISFGGLNDNNRPWLGVEKSRKIIDEVLDGRKTITDDDVVEISARTQWKFETLRENACNEKGVWSKTELVKACAKIPYNKKAKVLLWKLGQGFIKCCNKPASKYGALYAQKKAELIQKNNAGEFAEYAATRVGTVDKNTKAYKEYSAGKIPDSQITARATRWVEKIFLSHLFEQMYREKYNTLPPRYYALEHCKGHHDQIEPEIPFKEVS